MNIDKLISENKSSFNTEKPSEGHIQRFEQKLQKHHSIKKKQKMYLLRTSIAAAMVLLLLIPLVTTNYSQAEQTNAEFANVKMYYQSELDKEIQQLEPILNTYDENTRATIEEEIEKIQSGTDIINGMENIPNEVLIASTAKVYINSIESVRRLHHSLNVTE
ncbi:MAG: hypothetical protein LBP67_05535 [Bacteroidales bacterium]|jgi:hypothetical protein|nr:hypothetical protein [Bacteroidales bacterium]